MNANPALMIPLLIAGVAVAWFSHLRRMEKARKITAQWAQRNGFTLLMSEYRNPWGTPFRWNCARMQMVYRVAMKDAAGHYRQAWLRLGNWMGGLSSSEIEVKWENDTPLARRGR